MSASTTHFSRKTAFLVICGVLLAFVGCITIPLGDPEKSKVDDKLVGLWLSKPDTDKKQTLFSVVPYDARTCLVSEFEFTKSGDKIEPGGRFDWKMWLVDVNGQTFASLEMKNPQLPLNPEEKRFASARIVRSGDTITFQLVKDDFVSDAKITTPQQLHDLIAANLSNPKLFADALSLTKMTDSQKDEANSIFDAYSGK